MASPERLLLPDAELSRPALVLAKRFVQRWDLHARQLDDGSYVCAHEPLNVDHLFAHLRGEITLGAYLLDQESQARFIVLDADDGQAWERLGHLARMLASEDVPAYLERSRRGGHLWLFLAEGVGGREVRAFTLSERIKASVTVLEFVSQYVDLKPTASGAVGLCPFHDDHHPSFGVNTEGNYWNCWAGWGSARTLTTHLGFANSIGTRRRYALYSSPNFSTNSLSSTMYKKPITHAHCVTVMNKNDHPCPMSRPKQVMNIPTPTWCGCLTH
jgi:hypothetical protein